jgi:EmrB/QacA subfamily drug resistance transporter
MNNKNLVLLAVFLTMFSGSFMASGINVGLPTISREFSTTTVQLSWIATAYILTMTVFIVPLSRLADMAGIKRFFIIGLSVYTVGSALAAFANSAMLLIVLRVFQGIGASMISANSMSIIAKTFTGGDRGKALGIYVAAVYTGFSAGPFLGGLLVEHLGWRSLFGVNIPVGLTAIVLSAVAIRTEWVSARGKHFDLPGTAIYGFSVVTIVYGLTLLPAAVGFVLLASGLAGLLAFYKWESLTASPILDLNLFKGNKPFVLSNLAALGNYAATFSTVFLVSLYLQFIRGLTPEKAGLIMITQPIIQAILSPITGRLSDRIEPRIVSSIGMGITACGLLTLSLLNENTPLILIVLILMIQGVGFALFSSPNMNAIMSSVKPDVVSTASAIVNTMRTVGQTLSMAITTVILALIVGRVVITPEYHSSLMTATRVAFLLFAIVCGMAIFASLARGSIRGKVKGRTA